MYDRLQTWSLEEPSTSHSCLWVNTASGLFLRGEDQWYGKTMQGKFMPEPDALKQGYREARRMASTNPGRGP